MSERLSIEVARLGARLGEFLSEAFPEAAGPLAQGLSFLHTAGERVTSSGASSETEEPLDRLARLLKIGSDEIDLLLLAGMPEEHEGYAAVLRTLHPRGEPRPSAGLAAQVLTKGSRRSFLHWFTSSMVFRSGAVRLSGEVPFFERTLEPADALWPALHGCDTWPVWVPHYEGRPSLYGLDEWLGAVTVARAVRAVRQGQACTVLVTGDSDETAFHRGLALVVAAGRCPAGMQLTTTLEADKLGALKLHAVLRGAVPVLRLPGSEGPNFLEPPSFNDYPDTVLVCGRTGVTAARGSRPAIAVLADRLTAEARRAVWTETLPELRACAPLLAARFPVEPAAAGEVAADLDCLQTLEQRAPAIGDVAEAIRARGALALGGGVKLIRPSATWNQLILPRDHEEQLRAAIDRLDLQVRVLDEWGFLKGRSGARGVRMLFSGPPGTGKTLSAEVVAGALNVDLLVVDISRVVSKWIGETEKNLAAVFDAAERAQSVLFFDEADALFGRRTEVSDAHDRYANLETAYLLARLERFEGLAVLATNLRQNIDPAFLRRMEFVIDFDEPDCEQRYRLWRCHIPDQRLLAADANLYELAALYPVVGGFIRNAAVAAAFLAAADGGQLTRAHFIRTIRREYDKAGKAFPGVPAGTSPC